MPDNNLFFALSNSAPGKDVEFNEWYDSHHIREVPETHLGFISGRRFRLNRSAGVDSPWQYLAIYQLDPSLDPAAIHQDGRDHPGRTVPAGGTLSDDHVAWTWEPIGPRVVAPAAANPIGGEQQHVLLVLTNPAPGRESEFNEWYDTHLPETLEAAPGRVAAQRYRLTAAQREEQWLAVVPGRAPGDDERRPDQWLPWRYLTLYELEGNDIAGSHDADVDGPVDPGFAAWLFSVLPDPPWRTPSVRTATGAPA